MQRNSQDIHNSNRIDFTMSSDLQMLRSFASKLIVGLAILEDHESKLAAQVANVSALLRETEREIHDLESNADVGFKEEGAAEDEQVRSGALIGEEGDARAGGQTRPVESLSRQLIAMAKDMDAMTEDLDKVFGLNEVAEPDANREITEAEMKEGMRGDLGFDGDQARD